MSPVDWTKAQNPEILAGLDLAYLVQSNPAIYNAVCTLVRRFVIIVQVLARATNHQQGNMSISLNINDAVKLTG